MFQFTSRHRKRQLLSVGASSAGRHVRRPPADALCLVSRHRQGSQPPLRLTNQLREGIFQETLEQLPVNTSEEPPVKTSVPKRLHHIVRKELRHLHQQGLSAGGRPGDDKLF